MDPDRQQPAAGRDDEVDLSLIEHTLQMSVSARLDAASRHAATLERLRRAASSDR